MRKTKIICTIGPATDSYEQLKALHQAGMNVVRLNMSHGDHESHSKVIKTIKRLNHELEYPIPVLLDTQGPEIRTGNLQSDLELEMGDIISVTARTDNVEETSIHINYKDLVEQVDIGDKITVDNGLINLEVLGKSGQVMQCKVLDGGMLKSKRHVNLPGIRVNLPAITQKDREDIAFAIEQEVDFIALSFVRKAEDVLQLHELLGSKAGKIKVIAKIEDQEGVSNLEEIADVADGIMVARGDLGVEVEVEDLPNIQRNIVNLCQRKGRRVIVATHLLESMIKNPIPTRAEVTDVANAVYENVDAVMLSGETTIGKYPIKCVDFLDRIAVKSESLEDCKIDIDFENPVEKQHIAAAAVTLAESINAKGVLVITRRGLMANLVTNCRPFSTPIYAFTNDSRARRQMALNRSVIPNKLTFSRDPEKTILNALEALKTHEGLKAGDQLVVISDVIAGSEVDAIQIRRIV